eukprot:CCRYP_009357-RA/>CCRYP_009357-RA protein AED:0.38 eAED:0.48 QI:0/0/0/1/0/0/2/0/249
MLALNMPTTLSKHSTNTTRRHKIGKESDTSGSQSHGTITSDRYIFPCQATAGHRFHHPVPTKPQHQPYPHTPRTYGTKQQYAETEDNTALLSKSNKTFVQEVIGVFLYYARAVDCTMLPALGSLATQQAAPTQNTLLKIQQFLDYAMTHQDAMITYRASNMILAVHSDTSYLSETKARSRAGAFLHVRRQFIPSQQRRHLNPRTNHQTGHVFGCQSRTRHFIQQCKIGRTTATPSQGARPSTTAHSHTN